MKKKCINALSRGAKYSLFSIVIQIFLMSSLLAANGMNGQSIREYKVKLELDNASILETFKAIELNSPFKIFYKKKDINLETKINITYGEYTVAKVLEFISKDAKLNFKQINKNISVAPITNKEGGNNETIEANNVQDRTITGKVTSAEDGLPLVSLSVYIKGTTSGVATESDGSYSITVPQSATTLVFRYLGFVTQEVEINGRNSINVVMQPEVVDFGEVIVTALNIPRDAKTLPYTAQQVNAKDLNMAQQQNVTNALAGKVAGVQITTVSGARLGSSASIRIRGNISLTNDGDALWVVDGTPGINPQSINMDDVESVNILKGPNASALYGNRAENGVVMITTKRAAKGEVSIDFTTGITFEEAGRQPKYQNVYGGGGSSDWITYNYNPGVHPAEWQVFDGKKYHDYTDDASWGPKMDGSEYIPWYAWYPGSQYSFKTTTFDPQPNNVRDYWETGKTLRNNISLSKGGEGYSMRVSYTSENQTGLLPNTKLDKNYISAKLDFDVSERFSISTNVNYQDQETRGDFGDGYSNNATGSFSAWFHRDLDMDILRELSGFKTPTGNIASWNHSNVTAGTDFTTTNFNRGNYWYNPYTYYELSNNVSASNRVFGDVTLTYKLNDKFSISGTARRYEVFGRNENKLPALLANSAAQAGYFNTYSTSQSRYTEENYEFLATYSETFDDLSVDFNLGGNIRDNFSNGVSGSSSNGLVVPDLWSLSNSVNLVPPSSTYSRQQTRSIFARTTLGYKEMLFLEATVRNDLSSTLPVGNNGYIYPSVGGSFVFSELMADILPALSYGKIRAGYAEVGNELSPYRINTTYPLQTAQLDGNLLMSVPGQLVDPNITPITNSSFEIGTDLKFFERRAGLSFTYYNERHRDDIISASVSNTSGYSSVLQNGGETLRSGIELVLSGTPIRTGDFEWNLTFNWAQNKSEIISIADNLESLIASTGTFQFARVVHQEGQEWGQLRGTAYLRDANGTPILDANGYYTADQNHYFGSVLPDFNGGIVSSLSWKDLTFNMSLDYQKGGKFFSLSNHWASYSGLSAESAAINDNGKNIRDDVADGGGVHVVGVDANGAVVDKYVPAQLYFQQFFSRNRMAEPYIYDASYIKLRELSVNYRVPVTQLFGNSPFNSINVSFIARNPWLIATAKGQDNIDPSDQSQSYGENGQLPSTRSYGLSIKFGF
tara:strand:+ start:335462 stop:339010 length:3549 start_codon:yes stop_codon:yes gene_type:complete